MPPDFWKLSALATELRDLLPSLRVIPLVPVRAAEVSGHQRFNHPPSECQHKGALGQQAPSTE